MGQVWDAESPFVGEVMVVITYYFKGGALDVDNMPKPILDALNGLVYADDRQITDLVCRKRDRNRDLQLALHIKSNLHIKSRFCT